MDEVRLLVNGREYGGWTSVRITRGIEAIAGSFELSVSDRWAIRSEPWPIVEEDECSVVVLTPGAGVLGTPLITGYVDGVRLAYDAQSHSISVSGKDRAAELVENSALVGKWEFASTPLLTLAKRLADQHGISVIPGPGYAPRAPQARLAIDPGETSYQVFERACRHAGVLVVSNGLGGIVLLGPGAGGRAPVALIEGQNILAASAEYDATARFRRYVVTGQHHGTDEYNVGVAAVQSEASDPNVRRASRVLMIRAEATVTQGYAKTRAQWEASVRAARAGSFSVTVQGWTVDGALWPVNALVKLTSPMLRVDADLLITQATYTLDVGGEKTQLTLRRPDAYRPEPNVPEDPWKVALT